MAVGRSSDDRRTAVGWSDGRRWTEKNRTEHFRTVGTKLDGRTEVFRKKRWKKQVFGEMKEQKKTTVPDKKIKKLSHLFF